MIFNDIMLFINYVNNLWLHHKILCPKQSVMLSRASFIQLFLLVQIFLCGLATIKATPLVEGVDVNANADLYRMNAPIVLRSRRGVLKGALIGAVAGAGVAYAAKKFMDHNAKKNALKNQGLNSPGGSSGGLSNH